MEFKKVADFLWPIGVTLLALLVMPLAIEQYPEFFKENPWPLPVSTAIVVACWILPFFLHDRAKKIFSWVTSFGTAGKSLAVVVAIVILIGIGVGGVRIFQFHKKHLISVLRAKEKEPKAVISVPSAIEHTPQLSTQDLSGIQKSLDEINKNLSRMGRPTISAAQMDEIKEVDRLIVSRDEVALRQAFGFPKMMETNIRMNIAIVKHFRDGEDKILDLRPYLGTEWIIDSELAEGRIRRFGGGFQYDPPDGKRVYLLALPSEYSAGKKVLFRFANSSELPTSVVKAIKDLDDSVYKNANKLLHVLNDALKKDPNYYLRYDDQTSPEYFHQIDAMWLDHFIQLRPKADKVKDAIRQFLGVAPTRRGESQPPIIQLPYGNVAARCESLGNAIILFAEQRGKERPDPQTHREDYKEWFRLNDGLFRWRFSRDVVKIHQETANLHIDDSRLDDLIERHNQYFETRQRNVQGAIDHPEMFHLSLEDIREIGERFKFLAAQVPH